VDQHLGEERPAQPALLSLHLVEKPMQMLYTEGAIIVGSVYLFLPTMISTSPR
jgi:putative spermidine/putrescine transport system permease protein